MGMWGWGGGGGGQGRARGRGRPGRDGKGGLGDKPGKQFRRGGSRHSAQVGLKIVKRCLGSFMTRRVGVLS